MDALYIYVSLTYLLRSVSRLSSYAAAATTTEALTCWWRRYAYKFTVGLGWQTVTDILQTGRQGCRRVHTRLQWQAN